MCHPDRNLREWKGEWRDLQFQLQRRRRWRKRHRFPLRLDDLLKTIRVGQLRNDSLNASDVAADLLYGLVEFFLTTAR
jgi:hypothetical protein